MGKKKKFTSTWCSQTQIGHLFGFSAIKVGKILKELELKDNAGATQKAVDADLVKFTPMKDGTAHWMWNKKKIARLMEDAGYERKSQAESQRNRDEAEAKKLAREITKYLDNGEDKLAMITFDSLNKNQQKLVNEYLESL